MIRAITSFKPNSANAGFSDKNQSNSQINFKSAPDAADIARFKAHVASGIADNIKRSFLKIIHDHSFDGGEGTEGFISTYRKFVPGGVTNKEIKDIIHEAHDFGLTDRPLF